MTGFQACRFGSDGFGASTVGTNANWQFTHDTRQGTLTWDLGGLSLPSSLPLNRVTLTYRAVPILFPTICDYSFGGAGSIYGYQPWGVGFVVQGGFTRGWDAGDEFIAGYVGSTDKTRILLVHGGAERDRYPGAVELSSTLKSLGRRIPAMTAPACGTSAQLVPRPRRRSRLPAGCRHRVVS